MLRQRVRIHEVTHVKQSRRMGIAKFLMLYRYYDTVHGYRNNPLEEEARAAARGANRSTLQRLRDAGISVKRVSK
jgi:hypothetical protein